MEPSVEEGFSFLDLEDCDVEARNYLQTIIEQRGPPRTTGPTDPFVLNSPDRGGLAGVNNPRTHAKNAPLTQLPETIGSASYQPIESKSAERNQAQIDGTIQDRGITSSSTRNPTPGKGSIATNYVPHANMALSSRVPIRGGQQQPGNFQGPQPVKVKPIQQTPTSSAVSTYLASAPQVGSKLEIVNTHLM